MSPFREAGPQSNTKFEEKFQEFYKDVLSYFRGGGYEISPAEAVFLKQTVRDCLSEQNKIDESFKKTKKEHMDNLWTIPEVIIRFYWHYYGINLVEYFKNTEFIEDSNESAEQLKKQQKDLFEYIKKLREDRELM